MGVSLISPTIVLAALTSTMLPIIVWSSPRLALMMPHAAGSFNAILYTSAKPCRLLVLIWSSIGPAYCQPATRSNSAPAVCRLFAMPSGGDQSARLRATMLQTGRDKAVFQPMFANQLLSRFLSILWPMGMPRKILGSLEPS